MCTARNFSLLSNLSSDRMLSYLHWERLRRKVPSFFDVLSVAGMGLTGERASGFGVQGQ